MTGKGGPGGTKDPLQKQNPLGPKRKRGGETLNSRQIGAGGRGGTGKNLQKHSNSNTQDR